MKFEIHMGKIAPSSPPGSEGWERFFYSIGASIKKAVEDRIAEGLTVDGNPMLTGPARIFRSDTKSREKSKPMLDKERFSESYHGNTAQYSVPYEKWKRNKGRNVYDPGDRLALTGDMLRAWDVVEYDGRHAVVGFTSLQEALKAVRNHELRPTFAINQEEWDRIFAKVKAEFGFE